MKRVHNSITPTVFLFVTFSLINRPNQRTDALTNDFGSSNAVFKDKVLTNALVSGPEKYFTLSVRDREDAEGLIRESILEEDLEELEGKSLPATDSSNNNDVSVGFDTRNRPSSSLWSFYKRGSTNTGESESPGANYTYEDGGDWSLCSFSCGIGISHRLRSCRSSDKDCRRFMVEYKLCNTQPCPQGGKPQDLDFRYHQCKSYDGTPYRGRYFTWVPFENVRNPCALTCKAQGYSFVVVFSPKALDGTRCTNGSLDVCINGKCRSVGCDLQLGSAKKVDSCGNCGGDNSQCRRNLYYWQETEFSACSASCGGGYQMTSSFCKMVKPPKVVPSYFCEPKIRPAPQIRSCAKNDCPPKWFTDDWGPCPQKCGFSKQSRNVYCAQELKNKSLITVGHRMCHGPKPEHQRQCQLKKCSYWKTGFWSPCTVTCGIGIRMLELRCIGPEGGLSDDCEEKDKPSHIEKCYTNVTCPDEKVDEVNKEFRILSNSVAKDVPSELLDGSPIDFAKSGNEGVRGQSLANNHISKQLYDYNQNQATYSPNGLYLLIPDFRYVVSDWGQCSEACGYDGYRTRSVKCKVYYPYTHTMVDVPEDQCRGVFKPPSKEKCNQRNCQKDSPDVSKNDESSLSSKDGKGNAKQKGDVGQDGATKPKLNNDLPFAAAASSIQDLFIWKYRGFSDCTAKCLGGIQDSIILCVRENDGKVFDDNHCDLSRKPPPFQRTCNEYACPPRWEVSDYSTCSHSCGGGIQTRSVRCLHQTANGKANVYVVPPEMCPEPRPESKMTCNNVDCPPFWAVGNWSECSKHCESTGIQRRPVYCQQVTAKGHVAYLVDESGCLAFAEKPPFIRECKPRLSPAEVSNCANTLVSPPPLWQSPKASNSISSDQRQDAGDNKFSPWYNPLPRELDKSESLGQSYKTLKPLGLVGLPPNEDKSNIEGDDSGARFGDRQQNDASHVAMGTHNWASGVDKTKIRAPKPGTKNKGKGNTGRRLNKIRKMTVRIKAHKSQIMVPKGTFLKMKCNFKKDFLKAPIIWTKNGRVIPSQGTASARGNNRQRVRGNVTLTNISRFGALKIKNFRIKDGGKYECHFGHLKKTVMVKVIPPRKDWSRPFPSDNTTRAGSDRSRDPSGANGREKFVSSRHQQQNDQASESYDDNFVGYDGEDAKSSSLGDDHEPEPIASLTDDPLTSSFPRQPWNVIATYDPKQPDKPERDVPLAHLQRHVSVIGPHSDVSSSEKNGDEKGTRNFEKELMRNSEHSNERNRQLPENEEDGADDYENYFIEEAFPSSPSVTSTSTRRFAIAIPKSSVANDNSSIGRVESYGLLKYPQTENSGQLKKVYYITRPFTGTSGVVSEDSISQTSGTVPEKYVLAPSPELVGNTNAIDSSMPRGTDDELGEGARYTKLPAPSAVVEVPLDESPVRFQSSSDDIEPRLLYWQSYGWTKCSQTCGGNGIQIQVSLCHLKLSTKTTVTIDGRIPLDGGKRSPESAGGPMSLGQRLRQRYLKYAAKKDPFDGGEFDRFSHHSPDDNRVDGATTIGDQRQPRREENLDTFLVADDGRELRMGRYYKIVDDTYCEGVGLKRPPKFRRCGDGECPRWKNDPWQPCKASPCESLNVAVQERRVYCAYSNGTLAPRSSYDSPGCRMIERPPMRKECYNDKCKATWIASNWSPCSKSCGHGGITTRVIHCAWFNSTKSAGSHCIDQPRPETVRGCQNVQNCPIGMKDEEKICTDHSMYCAVTRRLNLCNVGDYKIRCCKTCSMMFLN